MRVGISVIATAASTLLSALVLERLYTSHSKGEELDRLTARAAAEWSGSSIGEVDAVTRQREEDAGAELATKYTTKLARFPEPWLLNNRSGRSFQRHVASALGLPRVYVAQLAGRGRGVKATSTIPSGTNVGLFRCLMLRIDKFEAWVADGTLNRTIADEFWGSYSIRLRIDEEEREMNDWPQHEWKCVPVGDAPGVRGSWWRRGPLDEWRVRQAVAAFNAGELADWRETPVYTGWDGTRATLATNAHLYNEPMSANGNVAMADGRVCALMADAESYDETATVCGEAMLFQTRTRVARGSELVWCYGHGFQRDYSVSEACESEGVHPDQMRRTS